MLTVVGLILGLVLGSAINAFIYRFASYKEREVLSLLDNDSLAVNDTFFDETTFKPRSFCDHCHTTLPPYVLIPILSYIIFKGRTHCCDEKIPTKYPLVELLCATWGVYCSLLNLPLMTMIPITLYGYGLIALALCDMEYQLVSDNHIDIIIFIVFSYLISLPYISVGHMYGYIMLYFILKSLSLSYYALTNKEGLGEGDVKMGAIIGLFHGVDYTSKILLISSITALMCIIYQMLWNKKVQSTIPFLPFLHGASLVLIIQTQYLS